MDTRRPWKNPRESQSQKYPPFAILYPDPPAPTRDAARIVVAPPAVLNGELEWDPDLPVLSMHGSHDGMLRKLRGRNHPKLGALTPRKRPEGGNAGIDDVVSFARRTNHRGLTRGSGI